MRGTGELPPEALLKSHGVDYHLCRSAGGKDKSGKPAKDNKLPQVWLGATLADRNGKTFFSRSTTAVWPSRPTCHRAMSWLPLDGLRINVSECGARTRRYRPGDKSELTVFRGDKLITLRVKWQELPADTCYLSLADEVDDVVSRRDAGLGQ